mgnify:CR=1 FL=1
MPLGGQHYLLELFHGPTLAFKDVAMQLLARLMDEALLRRGRRATIIGATSGDTGGAAIEAFRGRENIDIFIFFVTLSFLHVSYLKSIGIRAMFKVLF